MSQSICGLNFDQYLGFHREFLALAQNGASVPQMVACLQKWGQQPVWETGEEGRELDMTYYMNAGLAPWEQVLAQDPELAARRAMALMDQVNEQEHGALEEDSGIAIAGLSLEGYAELCATMHRHGGDATAMQAAIAPLFAKHGVQGMEHFTQINQAYQAAMAADDTGHMNSHYGRLFMKFSPQHQATVHSMVADAVAADQAHQRAEAAREANLLAQLRQMASGADPKLIADLVRSTYPEAEDEDTLDYYVEKVVDEMAEAQRWNEVQVLLATRFEILGPGGDRNEWVRDELESLR